MDGGSGHCCMAGLYSDGIEHACKISMTIFGILLGLDEILNDAIMMVDTFIFLLTDSKIKNSVSLQTVFGKNDS